MSPKTPGRPPNKRQANNKTRCALLPTTSRDLLAARAGRDREQISILKRGPGELAPGPDNGNQFSAREEELLVCQTKTGGNSFCSLLAFISSFIRLPFGAGSLASPLAGDSSGVPPTQLGTFARLLLVLRRWRRIQLALGPTCREL